MDEFYLDANGTDGSDPSKIDRVYSDGTRIPLSDADWKAAEKAAKEARRVELRSKVAKVKDEKLSLSELREVVLALAELMGGLYGD